jgi:hypothetical protein
MRVRDLMIAPLALALGSVLIMMFGIFLNSMNRLALRKLRPPVFLIYLGNAVAYGLAVPAIVRVVIWIVGQAFSGPALAFPGYGYLAVGNVYALVLLIPPVLGGAIGTVLTSSDYDYRYKGLRHILMLGAALALYVFVVRILATP